MKLAEYESIVAAVESGEQRGIAEAIEVNMRAVARECRTALWRSAPFRAEASAVADRAEAIARDLAEVTARQNHTPAEKRVATYREFVDSLATVN